MHMGPKQTLCDVDVASKCILHWYHIYIFMCSQNEGQSNNTFDEETLVMCVLDLFVAGTETTSTTLLWAFLYIAKYPEIQGKN